jgi:uncharacterized protein (DUF58 family)
MSQSPSIIHGAMADRLRRLELFSRLRVEGFLNGPGKSPLVGFSSDFRQHRQYVAGDNLKYLDWRVYGRSGKLMTRQYDETTHARISVVVDGSGSMLHCQGEMSKWEFAVRTAAVLLHVALLNRDAFSVSVFDMGAHRLARMGSGKLHLSRCLRALLERSASGGTDFDRGLGTALAPIRPRGLTVVLSDFMEEPEAVVKKLAHVRLRESDVLALQVAAPSEMDVDFNTITRFHDLENQKVISIDPSLIRRQYRETFAEHIEALGAECRRQGFEHHLLTVGDDFETPISAVLRKRMEVVR